MPVLYFLLTIGENTSLSDFPADGHIVTYKKASSETVKHDVTISPCGSYPTLIAFICVTDMILSAGPAVIDYPISVFLDLDKVKSSHLQMLFEATQTECHQRNHGTAY